MLETVKLGGFKPALRIAPDENYGVEKTPGLDYNEDTMNKIADDVIEKVKVLYEKLLKEKKELEET